ncbi:hypothetical protein ElyMa_003586600 [Elysia marginata]|uniref:Uncharacterized protein n=1 Tax=Elysia marginata TaxID=1093978 RepID=A0AAV4EQB0_9GAST|nr:hypothetical protein ElyMa_003586600 [Elysia marginata]
MEKRKNQVKKQKLKYLDRIKRHNTNARGRSRGLEEQGKQHRRRWEQNVVERLKITTTEPNRMYRTVPYGIKPALWRYALAQAAFAIPTMNPVVLWWCR